MVESHCGISYCILVLATFAADAFEAGLHHGESDGCFLDQLPDDYPSFGSVDFPE